MTTWHSDEAAAPFRATPRGWLRIVLRGPVLAIWIFGGLAVSLAIRLVERPLAGSRRPVTSHLTRIVCRGALAVLGIARFTEGRSLAGPGAMVANHSSWLDIFALNAGATVVFVSKSEVADWPGIGWLARATGTLFIRRDRREARIQGARLRERLAAGQTLVFFPEGTSTDGRRVLPFKSTLFAAFLSPGQPPGLSIQPVSVIYEAPPGAEARFYGWWGDMAFGPHLLKTMAAAGGGRVTLVYHPPLTVAAGTDRKQLARAAEDRVRVGLVTRLERRPQLRQPRDGIVR